jgi:hypothetical protein
MKFLSDILAKAGLVVDGVVTLNNTATGQTPDANDNSTKLATTAWVRTFVQPYSLPIASASVLGGIKVGNGLSIDAITGVLTASGGGNVGSFRSKQVFTATASQTTFTVSGGYTPGFIDVFINGVYINDDLYTATNSSTIVLDEAAALDDIITVFIYSPFYVGESPSSRDICTFTATAAQTTFSCSYVIGSVDVFYNGSKLAGSEFNASNGTTVVLNTACDAGDFVEVISWVAGGGLSSSRTITINGVTYDLTANRSWSALPVGGTAGQLLAKVDGTDYNAQWINEAPAASYTSQLKHRVKSAQAITKGQAVYVSSADGTNMIVSKASNASEATSSKTIGLLESTVSINGIANVITEGLLAGLDTTGANAAGDAVWLGTDGNLIYGLANKPVAPAHLVFIGVVTRRNANNGEIFVKVQNGFELDELHDLSVKNASDGDMIKYVASTGLWTKIAATTTNIGEGTSLYYTDARSRTAISLTTTGTSGPATYNNTTGVLNIPQYQGGVTSFNTRTGAITLSSSDVTTALTYTPVTNARTLTINGTTYDLSADRSWSIAAGVTSFNTRTGAISLTSLDVTDALTYTPVTNARTLSINGTTYDLTANRSWTVGVNPSARTIQTFTATANQTTFTIAGGYVVGLVDVFINGVRLTASDFTATNGTTVVLTTGTGVNNIVDVIKYTSAFIIDNALRQTTYFTATAGQTTFTVSYSPGLVDVFYNGSKLPSSEYTASNGTSIVLTTPAILNDIIEVTSYNYTVGAFTGQAQLNGTGFVKVSGTTVSYDNSTYLTTSSASSTYLPLAGGILTGTTRMDGSGGTVPSITMIFNSGINRLLAPVLRLYGATNESSNYIELFGTLATANRTINFPDASGTVALTSNIPANPVGGTGSAGQVTYWSSSSAITGESNLFWDSTNDRLGIGINTPKAITEINSGANASAIRITDQNNDGSSSTFRYTAVSYWSRMDGVVRTGTNPLVQNGSTAAIVFTDEPGNFTFNNVIRSSSIEFYTANNNVSGNVGILPTLRMSIASTGEATFTSTVQTSTFFRSNTATTNSITIGVSANANYGYIGNSNFWGIRTGTAGDFNIDLNNSGSPINALRIASTGAATFSSSLTLDSLIIANNDARIRNNDATGRIIISNSSTNTFAIFHGTSHPTQANQTVFANGGVTTCTFSSTGTATFFGALTMSAYSFASSAIQFTRSPSNSVTPASGNGIMVFAGGNAQMRMDTNNTINFDVNNGGNPHTALQIRQGGNAVSINSPDNNLMLELRYQNVASGYLGAIGSALYAYSVNGGYALLNNSSAWVPGSDIKRKRNFEPYTKGLSAILGLEPKLYNMDFQEDGDEKQVGLVAQEVRDFIPHAYEENADFIGLNYNAIIVTMVKAIQEQQEVIESLKSRIENLEQV